jgi:hypothetical protein
MRCSVKADTADNEHLHGVSRRSIANTNYWAAPRAKAQTAFCVYPALLAANYSLELFFKRLLETRLAWFALIGHVPAYAPDRDAACELRQRASMPVGTSSAVIA